MADTPKIDPLIADDGAKAAFKERYRAVCTWFHQGKSAFWVCYTVLFVIAALLCFGPCLEEGKHILWRVDGLSQGYVFYTYFGWWIRQGIQSLFETGVFELSQWNLSLGFGGDTFGALASTFVNPFNYISVFIPSKYAEYGFDISLILRIYCSGLAFSLFARRKGNGRFPTLVGSIAYAFSGWMMICFHQASFVNPMILFPLFLTGLESVFTRKSPALFIVSSALFFASNIAFSYAAFIFAVPYCVYLYIKKEPRKHVLTFLKWVIIVVGLAAIGALIASIILLPVVGSVAGQSRLGLERYVPLLNYPRYYTSLLEGFLGYAFFSGSVLSGGCLAVVACILIFARKGHRGLKVAFIILTICAVFPFLGSALNGFQYVSNRWMWTFALFFVYAITVAVPWLARLEKRDIRNMVIGVAVLSVLLFVLPGASSDRVVRCWILLIVFVFLLVVYFALRQKGVKVPRLACRTCLIVVVLASVFVPFNSYLVQGGAIDAQVGFGAAYKKHTEQSISAAVKQVEDDSLWRYDFYGVDRIRNNSLLEHLYSFDSYTSRYNNNVNGFILDLEVSDDQTCQTLRGLSRRSFLEAALGAKYFVVGGSETDSDSDSGFTPDRDDLPYGPASEPTVERVTSSGSVHYVFENEYALPLAYTFSNTMSVESYEALTAAQKQQAILQAVAVEGVEELQVDAKELSYDDVTLDYSIVGTKNAKVEDGKISVKKDGAKVTLEFDKAIPGELYVEFLGLTYDTNPPKAKEGESFSEWCNTVRKQYFWKHPQDYSLSVSVKGRDKVSFSNRTMYSHMYGGDNSNIINLGYIEKPVQKVTIKFDQAGVYTYEDLNVIVQPVDALDDYVSDRRTYPVELQEGKDSYVAHVANDEHQVLMLTIPRSRGWTATVDGEKAEILLADEVFMALDLPAGDHTIEFSYSTPNLGLGLALSSLGVVLAVLCVLIARRRRRQRAQE